MATHLHEKMYVCLGAGGWGAVEKRGFGVVLLPSLPAPGTVLGLYIPGLESRRGEVLFGCHLQLDDNVVSYHLPAKSNALLWTQLHKVHQHF